MSAAAEGRTRRAGTAECGATTLLRGGGATCCEFASHASSGTSQARCHSGQPASTTAAANSVDVLSGDPRPSSYAPTPSLSPSASDRLLSRAGHALLLDPTTPGGSTLYIHSGQRNEQYLNDLWAIRLAGVPPDGADERRGRSPLSRRDEPEREEEDEDGEANLWRQGTVLDFPFASSSAAAAVPANAAHAAVNDSLIDLSALPASPEASPSRAGFAFTASAPSTRQPTILQIRRLWPSSSSTADGATATEYPSPGFTQRVTLDPHTGVWTLLTGLTRASPASGTGGAGASEDNECLRGVWRRVPGSKRGPLGWEKIDVETHAAAGAGGRYGAEAGAEEAGPMGRYAAQVCRAASALSP